MITRQRYERAADRAARRLEQISGWETMKEPAARVSHPPNSGRGDTTRYNAETPNSEMRLGHV